MELAQKLINKLDAVKEKLPDKDYKEMCDLLKDLSTKQVEEVYVMNIVNWTPELIRYGGRNCVKNPCIEFTHKVITLETTINSGSDPSDYHLRDIAAKLKSSPVPRFIGVRTFHRLTGDKFSIFDPEGSTKQFIYPVPDSGLEEIEIKQADVLLVWCEKKN